MTPRRTNPSVTPEADPASAQPLPYTIRQSDEFKAWLNGLRDRTAAAIIARRLDRLSRGNKGDVRSVGDGVSEMRIDIGPGYRIYFVERGGDIIILLNGGDKDSQPRDVKRAKALASEV
jgi:putative addiction module killer protein